MVTNGEYQKKSASLRSSETRCDPHFMFQCSGGVSENEGAVITTQCFTSFYQILQSNAVWRTSPGESVLFFFFLFLCFV